MIKSTHSKMLAYIYNWKIIMASTLNNAWIGVFAIQWDCILSEFEYNTNILHSWERDFFKHMESILFCFCLTKCPNLPHEVSN